MSSNGPESREAITLSFLGRSGDFQAWFRVYDDLVSRRRFHINPPTSTKAVSHTKILEIAKDLAANISWTRDECIAALFQASRDKCSEDDLENALDIAVQATFMIDCVATQWHASNFRLGGMRPTCWAANETFLKFMENSFPISTNIQKAVLVLENQDALKAWKLEKRLGLTFKGTNNLADHLLYDRRHNTVYLFHHVAFLDAHFGGFAKNLPFESGMEASLSNGTLPPRLLFETLHSLQSILFPSIDPKAHRVMEQLVKSAGFDPACKEYNGYRHKDTQYQTGDLYYKYWAERLADLHDLLLQRPPRNKWERWVQWQSSEANAFAIAILALLISIVVGIISIILSAVQIGIAWMAWKYPVQ